MPPLPVVLGAFTMLEVVVKHLNANSLTQLLKLIGTFYFLSCSSLPPTATLPRTRSYYNAALIIDPALNTSTSNSMEEGSSFISGNDHATIQNTISQTIEKNIIRIQQIPRIISTQIDQISDQIIAYIAQKIETQALAKNHSQPIAELVSAKYELILILILILIEHDVEFIEEVGTEINSRI
jgi:hypothetical protein